VGRLWGSYATRRVETRTDARPRAVVPGAASVMTKPNRVTQYGHKKCRASPRALPTLSSSVCSAYHLPILPPIFHCHRAHTHTALTYSFSATVRSHDTSAFFSTTSHLPPLVCTYRAERSPDSGRTLISEACSRRRHTLPSPFSLYS